MKWPAPTVWPIMIPAACREHGPPGAMSAVT